jgi:hypothetical protein
MDSDTVFSSLGSDGDATSILLSLSLKKCKTFARVAVLYLP